MPDMPQTKINFYSQMTSISENYWEEQDICSIKNNKKTKRGTFSWKKKQKKRPESIKEKNSLSKDKDMSNFSLI